MCASVMDKMFIVFELFITIVHVLVFQVIRQLIYTTDLF